MLPVATEGAQGLILYQTCCFWLQPEELCFPGSCCRIFLPRHSSFFCLPLYFMLALTKKGKEELSSTEQQRKKKRHQILACFLCFSQMNVFGGLVLITRSWQVPSHSDERFYQVLRKSWRILVNSQAFNLLTSKFISNIFNWKAYNNDVWGNSSVLYATIFGEDGGCVGRVVKLMWNRHSNEVHCWAVAF